MTAFVNALRRKPELALFRILAIGRQDVPGAKSKLPVLGHTVPYAVGNILLTAWGPVIVMLKK